MFATAAKTIFTKSDYDDHMEDVDDDVNKERADALCLVNKKETNHSRSISNQHQEMKQYLLPQYHHHLQI